MKNLTFVLLLLLNITYYSCSKDSSSELISESSVYILQNTYKGPNENGVIQLYKNGNVTDITSKENDAWGINMYIENNNVYILGTEKENGGTEKTKVWKNGEELSLPISSNIQDIAIAGSDLYLLATEYVNKASKIVLYKNGQPTSITEEADGATPKKIKIIGTDVYILGISNYKIAVWKNGTPTYITDGNYNATPIDFVVNNDDIYVLGREFNGLALVPKLWKNGTQVSSFITNRDFVPVSLLVENENIYITGNSIKTPRVAQLWQNGETNNIGSAATNSYVSNVLLKDNKVYVSYHEANQFKKFISKLWIDGEITDISNGNTDTYSQKIIIN